MSAITEQPKTLTTASSLPTLARELATAYRERVDRLKYELGLSTPEAVAKADEPCSLSRMWHIENCPADQITWTDLEELNRLSPERYLKVWENVQQAGREAIQSGHLAAAVLEGRKTDPWKRSQFLAIRAELTEGWQPRNGLEQQIIDQMAQAQAATYSFHHQLADWVTMTSPEKAEVVGMIERFNRMFLRLLRSLCSLRKVPLAVIVQNAGQVNVGGQQVNVSSGER